MANSKPEEVLPPKKRVFTYRHLLILLVVALVGFAAGRLLRAQRRPDGELPAHTVQYRYRFGGEVITHILPNVESVTLYRTAEEVDQVVFNLMDGRDYVLNTDIMVDYTLPPDGSVESQEKLNELYYHYDPYLQGEKQQWHHKWVDEQYMKWAGRLPTDEEWLEALNELTRGVEHHQMEWWIQYSPPACEYFVTQQFSEQLGYVPGPEIMAPFIQQLFDGKSYEEVEKAIAAEAKARK